MPLPQENYERATRSARDTLNTLTGSPPLELKRASRRELQSMLWDLEAMGASIRLELMHREDVEPVDLGT